MLDRVALSAQTSQDKQNNNVKHTETISLFVYFKLHVYFEWSLPVPLITDARTTAGKSPI